MINNAIRIRKLSTRHSILNLGNHFFGIFARYKPCNTSLWGKVFSHPLRNIPRSISSRLFLPFLKFVIIVHHKTWLWIFKCIDPIFFFFNNTMLESFIQFYFNSTIAIIIIADDRGVCLLLEFPISVSLLSTRRIVSWNDEWI